MTNIIDFPQAPPGTARPTIELAAGELATAVKEAEGHLIKANAGIYQRGGQLVRVVQFDPASLANRKPAIQRPRNLPFIIPATKDYLTLAMSEHIEFRRYDGREKKSKRVDPPSTLASLMLADAGNWKFPSLRGIVSAPTLRPDGSLLSVPGYDTQSGLLLWNDGTLWPRITEKPPRDIAEDALNIFTLLLAEFEFQDGPGSASAAAAKAAILSACIRYALPTAPAYGLNAHKAGSGKTTLGDTIARIPTGLNAAVMPLGEDETEVRKAILAVLMAADLIVLIDNVNAPVESAALCAVLTSESYKDRILGESRIVTLPTSTTWLVNGNNLEIVGDLTSRIIMTTLDPQCENPENRVFKVDIRSLIIERRIDFVMAALTIPLAYLAAGEPKVNAVPSRFPEWDRLVRFPLIWLGAADPLATQRELKDADPIRQQLASVMTTWHDIYGTSPTTAAELIEAAGRTGQSANPKLAAALVEVAGDRAGTINSRKLGWWMKRSMRRIENGLRIEDAGEDPTLKVKRYKVVRVSGVSGVSESEPDKNGEG